MITSAFLRTLSLSAEQNCAQNSGAKRRDDINCLIMGGSWFAAGNLGWLQIMMLRGYRQFKVTGDGERALEARRCRRRPSARMPQTRCTKNLSRRRPAGPHGSDVRSW